MQRRVAAWLKTNKERILILILLAMLLPMYQLWKSNQELIKNQTEYYERVKIWTERSKKYESEIDSIKKKEAAVKDSIEFLATEINLLEKQIKNMKYETNVDDHVRGISDNDLLKSIRSRYAASSRE